MIILKTEILARDIYVSIFQQGQLITGRSMGFKGLRIIRNLPKGEYELVARKGMWRSQPYHFNYDGETSITFITTATADYSELQRLWPKRKQAIRIVVEPNKMIETRL